MMRASGAAVDEIGGAGIQRHQNREREDIEPLIGVHRQTERRIRLDDGDALHPAGPRLERARLQQLRHRHRQRKRRQRKIDALEPQRRQSEQKSGDQADKAGGRQRPVIGHVALVHQDRRGVGADGKEGGMAERKLAVEPGEQIEPKDRDGVDHRQRKLEDEKILHHERQRHRDDDRHGDENERADSPASSCRASGGRRSLALCCVIATRPG